MAQFWAGDRLVHVARFAPDRSVLVVEDDPLLRELYRSALRSAGFAVVAVEDGLQALQRVESECPDVMVLDLLLPRLGGRDVHRELKSHSRTRHVPIVIVSGNDVSDLNPRDFAGILQKPINAETLVLAVEHSLGRSPRGIARS
jgi:CheY-like chemotaxis protein